MQHRYKSLVLILGLCALITACGGNNPPPPPPEVIIPSTTKVLAAPAQAALETVQPTSLTFTGSQAIATGDVIVSPPTAAAPDGFLRKVSSVQTSNGKTMVTTAPASLRDAIQKGSLDVTRALSVTDIESTTLASGVTYQPRNLRPQADDPTFVFDKVLFDKDGNNATKNDQVTLGGSLDLSTSFRFDVDIDLFPPNFDLLAEAKFTEKATLFLKGKVSFDFNKTLNVGTIKFKPITFSIGPIPVVIRPVVKLDIGVRGSASGEVSVNVSQTMVVTAGAKYDEEWTNLSDVSNDFDLNLSDIKAAVKAEAFSNVTLELLLYESVGLFVKPEIFVGSDAQFPRRPFWKLDAGIGIDVGVEIDKWGIDKTFKRRVFEKRFPIAQSPNQTPTLTLQVPTSADLNRPVSLVAGTSDPEEGFALQPTWTSNLPADGALGTGTSISKAFTTTGNRTITATARDSDGATVSQSQVINIINTAPVVSIAEPTSTSVIYQALRYNFQYSTRDINEPDDTLNCANVRWTSSVTTDVFAANACNFEAVFSSIGSRTITLLGTDPQGLSNSQSVQITVLPTPANQPPNPVRITSPNPNLPLIGCTGVVTLVGTATDPEGGAVKLEWFVAAKFSGGNFGNNIKVNPNNQGQVDIVAALGLTNAEYSADVRITLIASDPQNNQQSNSIIFKNAGCIR